jgi:hypothetical protein
MSDDAVKVRAFKSEAALVRALVSSLRSGSAPWSIQATAREFDYQRGRTDVVAVSSSGQVVSFEAKLGRWRQAMHQAYRNTCFAHLSYVLLPEAVAVKAKSAAEEFDLRAVGICTMKGAEVVVVHEPQPIDPLQPWLSERAAAAAKPIPSRCRTSSRE